MWQDDADDVVHLNWIPILSLTGSIACSLVIWFALIRAVEYFLGK